MTTTCRCPAGPVLVATWRRGRLVDVELRHLLSAGCTRPRVHADVRDFLTEIPTTRRRC